LRKRKPILLDAAPPPAAPGGGKYYKESRIEENQAGYQPSCYSSLSCTLEIKFRCNASGGTHATESKEIIMTKALAKSFSVKAHAAPSTAAMELVCQAGSLAALRTVIDSGADCVHLDYQDAGASANFNHAVMSRGIRYAHDKGCKVLLALNTPPRPFAWEKWRDAIDRAVQSSGVDAMIFSDPALLLYAAANYPQLDLHFSLSDAPIGPDTINVFHRRYGVSRILLPRVLTLAQLADISKGTSVELEVFGFGRDCSIVAGRAPASEGEETRPGTEPARVAGWGRSLQNVSIERCAGADRAANENCYAAQASPGVSALAVLPQLRKIGVRAIKVEARGPALADVAQITRIWREAIDLCLRDPQHYAVKASWLAECNRPAGQPAAASDAHPAPQTPSGNRRDRHI
jgi:putative protease